MALGCGAHCRGPGSTPGQPGKWGGLHQEGVKSICVWVIRCDDLEGEKSKKGKIGVPKEALLKEESDACDRVLFNIIVMP